MAFSDKLKDLTKKAKEAAAEHQDQLQQAVETAGVVADRRTRGRYSNQITKAGEKASSLVDSLAPKDAEAADAAPAATGTAPAAADAAPAASSPPVAPAPAAPAAPTPAPVTQAPSASAPVPPKDAPETHG